MHRLPVHLTVGLIFIQKATSRWRSRCWRRRLNEAPNYALSWANLGKSYTASASFQFGGGEQYRKVQFAFEQALRLQPEEIEARIYMANMFQPHTGEWKRPFLCYERPSRQIRIKPRSTGSWATHTDLPGMLPESIAESERARQLDPGVKLNSSTLNGYLYLGHTVSRQVSHRQTT